LKNVNPAFEDVFQLKKNEVIERDFISLLGKNNERLKELYRDLPSNENGIDYTTYTATADGDIIIEWQLKQNIGKQRFSVLVEILLRKCRNVRNWKVRSAGSETFLRMPSD
jgi:PAS domain-containing protein